MQETWVRSLGWEDPLKKGKGYSSVLLCVIVPLRHALCTVLLCSWASLVAQLVKNLPAMWETWVRSLSWEDPLEKGKATHSSILAWRIP